MRNANAKKPENNLAPGIYEVSLTFVELTETGGIPTVKLRYRTANNRIIFDQIRDTNNKDVSDEEANWADYKMSRLAEILGFSTTKTSKAGRTVDKTFKELVADLNNSIGTVFYTETENVKSKTTEYINTRISGRNEMFWKEHPDTIETTETIDQADLDAAAAFLE